MNFNTKNNLKFEMETGYKLSNSLKSSGQADAWTVGSQNRNNFTVASRCYGSKQRLGAYPAQW